MPENSDILEIPDLQKMIENNYDYDANDEFNQKLEFRNESPAKVRPLDQTYEPEYEDYVSDYDQMIYSTQTPVYEDVESSTVSKNIPNLSLPGPGWEIGANDEVTDRFLNRKQHLDRYCSAWTREGETYIHPLILIPLSRSCIASIQNN